MFIQKISSENISSSLEEKEEISVKEDETVETIRDQFFSTDKLTASIPNKTLELEGRVSQKIDFSEPFFLQERYPFFM